MQPSNSSRVGQDNFMQIYQKSIETWSVSFVCHANTQLMVWQCYFSVISRSLCPFSYWRFLPLQIRTCVFLTCVFNPCISVLEFSTLTFSTLVTSYLGFPYFLCHSFYILAFSVLAFSVAPNVLVLSSWPQPLRKFTGFIWWMCGQQLLKWQIVYSKTALSMPISRVLLGVVSCIGYELAW